jgi:uncharacterized protein (TIGR00290 family)
MKKREKVSVSWSGGKDCTLALYKILQEGKYEVVSLHTYIDFISKKVGLHGIPEALIEKQARILNFPLEKIYVNNPESSHSFEMELQNFYNRLKGLNIRKIICGDIFLEDLRAYKVALAEKVKLDIEFPLWGSDTKKIVTEFIELGFNSIISSADADVFSQDAVGKFINMDFIKNLPEGVDACGENGEFHSFTIEGPIFEHKLDVNIKGLHMESYNFKTTSGEEITKQFFYADFADF